MLDVLPIFLQRVIQGNPPPNPKQMLLLKQRLAVIHPRVL